MCAALVTSASVFKDPGFPLAAVRIANHGASGGLHRHEFHELVIITEGRGRHCTDTEDYPLTAGDAFLLCGDMQHGYDDVDQMNLINVLFNPAGLGLPLNDLGELPGYQVLFHIEPRLRRQARFGGRLHMSPAQLAEAVRLAGLLEAELRTRAPGYRFTARAQLMQLIAHLSRCYTVAKRAGPQPLLRLGELLSYLDRHYCEPISVEQMLPIARMSQSTLMRTFHRVFQRSPIDYLIRLRIQKATELLADGELRIGEVALACGFNDSNYFTRQFRRVTGRSPREYRKAG